MSVPTAKLQPATKPTLKLADEPAVVKPFTPDSAVPPLEDRLTRLGQLFELQTKYNRLQASFQKLGEFKMKKGEEHIELSIEDKHGRENFTTQNPEVIKEVLEFIRLTITEKRKAIEPLLKW